MLSKRHNEPLFPLLVGLLARRDRLSSVALFTAYPPDGQFVLNYIFKILF